jgi:hypothetical protein
MEAYRLKGIFGEDKDIRGLRAGQTIPTGHGTWNNAENRHSCYELFSGFTV